MTYQATDVFHHFTIMLSQFTVKYSFCDCCICHSTTNTEQSPALFYCLSRFFQYFLLSLCLSSTFSNFDVYVHLSDQIKSNLLLYVSLKAGLYNHIHTKLDCQVHFLTTVLRHEPYIVYWFHHFSNVLEFANSCINPFIYAATYREFQNGIRRMMARVTGNASQIQPQ